VLRSLGKGLAVTSEERSNGRICRNCGILTDLHLNDGLAHKLQVRSGEDYRYQRSDIR
jgi:hypothetical protein